MSVFRFGAYEVALDAYELRRGGEPVHLEPKVFEVLAHLCRNAGRVVSKEATPSSWRRSSPHGTGNCPARSRTP